MHVCRRMPIFNFYLKCNSKYKHLAVNLYVNKIPLYKLNTNKVFLLKMEEAAEYQFKFNYLFGNTGTKQLYYDFQLWYCVRENYWGCVNPNCNSFIY